MDEGSFEELRVYGILQEHRNEKYTEAELKKIFNFECSVNQTRLYKYIRMFPKDINASLFTILDGELVSGRNIEGRTPVKRGKYSITAVIDGVKFTYVERN